MSEIHDDRAPLAGVVRELEAQPTIDGFLSIQAPPVNCLLTPGDRACSCGCLMERLEWRTTGKKGSFQV